MGTPLVLGGLPVVQDPAELARRGRATFRTRQTLSGVVRVQSLTQLQQVVRDARAQKVPLYPVSQGRNWGYGSSVPVRGGCVLVDLSQLNRVVRSDEAMGYVAIQPGLTVSELSQFVREQLPSRFLPVTGAPPSVSVLGNLLERGQALGPLGDRFTAATNLQVVLPTGELIRTNLGAAPGAIAADVCKWGQGPLVEGLFTQSAFGIVTEATLMLPRRPRYFQACFAIVPTETAFDALVDALHEAMADGVLKETSAAFWNEFKIAGRVAKFPWETARPGQALSHEDLDAFRGEWGGGVWAGRIALYAATFAEALGQRAALGMLLRRLGMRPIWASGLEARARRLLATLPWVRRQPGFQRWEAFLDEVYERSLFLGYPSERSVDSVYWRKRPDSPRTEHPDDDGCGLIWGAFPLPCRSADVRRATELIVEHVRRGGFEPMLSVVFQTERHVNEIVNLSYDRDVPGEDERAEHCYLSLLEALAAEGIYPYRLPTLAMRAAPEWLRTLKGVLDPDGLISPGRYGL